MSKQVRIAVALVILLAAGLSAFLIVLWAAQKPDGAASREPGPAPETAVVRRIPERVPSAGLRWSMGAYPEQYGGANLVETHMSAVRGEEEKFKQRERVMDVAGQAYCREFNTRFSYAQGGDNAPEVHLTYLKGAETFAGQIVARRLKPNFAYQVKLRGLGGYREAFERIGSVGRWRLPGHGTNCTDEQYREAENKDEAESYLFFDFFVTDSQGNAVKRLYGDSSLHVLFNAGHQRRHRPADSMPRKAVLPGTDPTLYANPRAVFKTQYVQAQSEENMFETGHRPPIGDARLPPGRYVAELVLTEESFHGYGDAGRWKTVMRAPVEFQVLDQPRPSRTWRDGQMVGEAFSCQNAQPEGLSALRAGPEFIEAVAEGKAEVTFAGQSGPFPPGRYCLAWTMQAQKCTEIWVDLDNGDGWEVADAYPLKPPESGRPTQIQLEVTSRVENRSLRAWRMRFAGAEGQIRLEDPRLLRLPGGGEPDNSPWDARQRAHKFEAETLMTRFSGSVVRDPEAENGYARRAHNVEKLRGLVLSPFIELAPGRYEAIYRLRRRPVEEPDSIVAYVDVSENKGETIAQRPVRGSDLPGGGTYGSISLPFTASHHLVGFEFHVFPKTEGVTLDWCAVRPVEKEATEEKSAGQSEGNGF